MDISKFKTVITEKLGNEPAEPPPPEKKPRMPLFIVAGVVIAGLAGGAYFFFAGGGPQDPDSDMDTSSLNPAAEVTPLGAATVASANKTPPGFNNSAAVNVQSEPTATATLSVSKPAAQDRQAAVKERFEKRREKLAKARKQQLQALYKKYPQRRGPDFTKRREQINKKFQVDLKKIDQEEKLALSPPGKAKPVNKAKAKAKKVQKAAQKNKNAKKKKQ
jgi:hypothetical protein